MAVFRKIHTSFWSDVFIESLTMEQKLFYLYLLTNEKTKQCGIYEISKKQVCYDLDINLDKANKMLNFFIDKNKIMYSEGTNEIAIRNWDRYNGSTSPKVVSCLQSELSNIKNTLLIQYIYSIDSLSQEEEEQEEEQEEEKKPLTPKGEVIDFDILLQTYNKIYNKKCVVINQKVRDKYKILLKQGYTKANIHTAMLNCKKDTFHKESDFKYCSIGYFSRPNTMDLHGTELITEKKGIVGTYTIHDHD